MLAKECLQTACVPIHRAEVNRRVPIHILCIFVRPTLQQSAHHANVAPNAGYVQRSPLIFGPRIQICTEFVENLDHFHMTLIWSNVQWGPAVRVALVEKCSSNARILTLQQLVAGHVLASLREHPNVSQEFLLHAQFLLQLQLFGRVLLRTGPALRHSGSCWCWLHLLVLWLLKLVGCW